MARLLLCLLILCTTGYAVRRGDSGGSGGRLVGTRGRPCSVSSSISWASGKESEVRAVNLTRCSYGTHTFQIDRPVNSSKAIRARIMSMEEGSDIHFEISVIESGVSPNGAPLDLKRKDLTGVDDNVISSPYTSLKVIVKKRGPPGKAEITFQFTLEDNGCPYPFLASHIGMPLIINSDVLAQECDFAVTAADPGSALELTSINMSLPQSKHSMAIVIYDGFSNERLHRVEQSEFDKDLKEHLGTSKIVVHLTNPMGWTTTKDVAFVTINSIVDDCSCPESKIILSNSSMVYKFKMEKLHCFHLNCSVSVQIAEPLRSNYRLKASAIYYKVVTPVFSIRDGIADDFNMRFIPETPSFVSVHPQVVLTCSEGTHPTDDHVTVELVETTKEQLDLCNCPPFASPFTFIIDPSCPPFDCLWTLPKIDYEFIPTLAVGSNSTGDQFETFTLVTLHGKTDRVVSLENGVFEALYYPEDKVEMPHIVLHFHRIRTIDPSLDERQRAPAFYRLIVSSHYNLTKYEEDCDCFNRTISVNPSKELVFSSPRHPLHYCNNLYCETTFVAPRGYRVVFRPYKISLPEGDYLRIYEVIDGVEMTREKYSGNYLDGFTTDSRTNKLMAVFSSDGSINYNGFNSSVFAEKIETDSSDFEDIYSENSKTWLWMMLLCLIMVGALVGGAVYKKRRSDGFSLSFAPVSFMNTGGDYDDGSISLYEPQSHQSLF